MALKLSLYCFHVIRYDCIVCNGIYPMRYSAMTIRANGRHVQWMIRSALAKCMNMMDFEIRFSVTAHEGSGMFAAFTVSARAAEGVLCNERTSCPLPCFPLDFGRGHVGKVVGLRS